MTKYFLRNSVIETKVQVEDWKEGIKKAGDLLLEIEGIKTKYIEKMINNVIELGPYIVISKGIALAHARPEDGVNFTCMSLITLNEPINFGNESNDPVEIIIAIATINNDEHIEILKKLASVLSDRVKYEKIINANNKNEIANLLNS
jgi:mannitol/fructose-specific phosphotransferase system IIA component (Ntr-type)